MTFRAILAGRVGAPCLGLAMLAACMPSGRACAQESSGPGGGVPDKSGYTLFDPTPASEMRAFSTDRPNKATSPYTVDAGHFQYETDLLGGAFDNYDSAGRRVRELFAADPLLKLGVANFADVEVALGGYQTYAVRDREGDGTLRYDGFGDVVVRTKLNVLGNDSGPVAIALVPFFKIPTATRGLGNGVGEFGVIIPLQASLPLGLTAQTVTEFDDLKNPDNTGRHAGFANVFNLSHKLTSKLTASVEVATFVQTAHIAPQSTLDLALAYLLGPNTQLDVGSYVGLNKAATDLVAYVGLSQRF